MKTPAINLINATNTLGSGGPSGVKQSGNSSDMQFKQILSRGIEERRKDAAPRDATPSKPVAKENTAARQTAHASQSTAKTTSPKEGKPTAADQAPVAEAPQDATAPLANGKARTKVDAASEEDEAVLAANSDELLALVANLTQVAAPAAGTPGTATAQTNSDSGPAAIHSAAVSPGANTVGLTTVDPSALDLTGAGKGAATAQATLTELGNRPASEAVTREESGNTTAFGATLAQAQDRKVASEANSAASQALSGANELKAATQATADLSAAKAPIDTQPVDIAVAPVNVAPQSQASIHQVQAAAAATPDKLAPRVGTNGWDQALGQKVVWMVAGELQSASLTLNPPDLGPLEVVLNVSNNQATVSFTAAQPEVRQALEDAVPKLREMLGDAGIQLGEANVSAGTPNNQQGRFGDRQQASGGTGDTADDGENAPVQTVRSQAITGGQGLVDTFA